MFDSDKNISDAFSDRTPIQGVALDMDGLLFDTERLYWKVGDTVLLRRGHRFCAELQNRMMGRVGVDAILQMIEFFDLTDDPHDLLAESNEEFGALLEADLKSMPGLDEWIAALRASALPFGLATSSQRKWVDVILQDKAWRQDLAFILTGDDVENGKPHPEMYLKAAGLLNIQPSELLVLEDSGNGCAAGVAAGAQTVAIPSQHTESQSFEGAILIADSLKDPRLLGLLSS